MGHIVSLVIWLTMVSVDCQDYEVADIACALDASTQGQQTQSLYARLRVPDNFDGVPVLADKQLELPDRGQSCQIRRDQRDGARRTYILHVNNLSQCGVFVKKDHIHVRVWFPRARGVVTAGDQQVIIVCRPPSLTHSPQRATLSSSSALLQHHSASTPLRTLELEARVSGVVEPTGSETLNYTVAVYKPMDGGEDKEGGDGLVTSASHHTATSRQNNWSRFVVPVLEPVPIGTRVQLRATIVNHQVWRFSKLLEVTVSNSRDDPYAQGHVTLISNGCRNAAMLAIVLTQPQQQSTSPHEVYVTMETFMLGARPVGRTTSQLWLHSKLLACTEKVDCAPEFCLDLQQPSGHGRRKRRQTRDRDVENRFLKTENSPRVATSSTHRTGNWTTFGDNVGLRILLPISTEFGGNGGGFVADTRVRGRSTRHTDTCASLIVLVAVLASFLVVSCVLLCALAVRVHRSARATHIDVLDQLMCRHINHTGQERERVRKLHVDNLSNPHYMRAASLSAGSSEY